MPKEILILGNNKTPFPAGQCPYQAAYCFCIYVISNIKRLMSVQFACAQSSKSNISIHVLFLDYRVVQILLSRLTILIGFIQFCLILFWIFVFLFWSWMSVWQVKREPSTFGIQVALIKFSLSVVFRCFFVLIRFYSFKD